MRPIQRMWQRIRLNSSINAQVRVSVRAFEQVCRMRGLREASTAPAKVAPRSLLPRTRSILRRLLARGATSGEDPETVVWETTGRLRVRLEKEKERAVRLIGRRNHLRKVGGCEPAAV